MCVLRLILLKFDPYWSIDNKSEVRLNITVISWCRIGDRPMVEYWQQGQLTYIWDTGPQEVKNKRFISVIYDFLSAQHIDDLIKKRHNSSPLAMESRLCIKPSILPREHYADAAWVIASQIIDKPTVWLTTCACHKQGASNTANISMSGRHHEWWWSPVKAISFTNTSRDNNGNDCFFVNLNTQRNQKFLFFGLWNQRRYLDSQNRFD